jgi:hypothetical protein
VGPSKGHLSTKVLEKEAKLPVEKMDKLLQNKKKGTKAPKMGYQKE